MEKTTNQIASTAALDPASQDVTITPTLCTMPPPSTIHCAIHTQFHPHTLHELTYLRTALIPMHRLPSTHVITHLQWLCLQVLTQHHAHLQGGGG